MNGSLWRWFLIGIVAVIGVMVGLAVWQWLTSIT